MAQNIKYLLFDPADSLYVQVFKYHRFNDATYISLKAVGESIGYTEKLFPGDDRDQIIMKENNEFFFKLIDGDIEERLNAIINTRKEIIFVYSPGQDNQSNVLVDFIFYEEKDNSKVYNFIKFPFKINSFDQHSDQDLDFDDLW